MTPLNATGLIAATFTAFHSDGELNLDQIERQAEALARVGIVGAFVCGTTGEGQTLSNQERQRVLERWCAVAPKDFRIIAHVGHVSLAEAAALARHAAKCGVAGIAAIPPYFFKSQNVDDILTCAAKVAAAAPNLPFYYYHFPVMSGISIAASELLRQGIDRIPNLCGLKFTDDNLMEFERCIAVAAGRMDLFLGREGMMLAGMAMGGKASIGSSLNFAAPVYGRLRAAFEAGDIARARQEQAKANSMLAIFLRFGGLRAQKAATNMVGPDCGPVRPSLRPLGDSELASMRKELEAVGFFDFIRPA
ncbi:MAG TPA: dihydrodipicolinate synthase family protein [Tepidisphaeraceae bacterium]